MALGTSLASLMGSLEEGRLVFGDTIGDATSGSGQEVDFCPVRVPTAGGSSVTTPVESKWVSQGRRSEAKVIENKCGRGILARKILDLDRPAWAVPAPMLALLLR